MKKIELKDEQTLFARVSETGREVILSVGEHTIRATGALVGSFLSVTLTSESLQTLGMYGYDFYYGAAHTFADQASRRATQTFLIAMSPVPAGVVGGYVGQVLLYAITKASFSAAAYGVNAAYQSYKGRNTAKSPSTEAEQIYQKEDELTAVMGGAEIKVVDGYMDGVVPHHTGEQDEGFTSLVDATSVSPLEKQVFESTRLHAYQLHLNVGPGCKEITLHTSGNIKVIQEDVQRQSAKHRL